MINTGHDIDQKPRRQQPSHATTIYMYIYIYVYKKTWEQPCLGPHMTEAVERTAAYKVQLLRSTTSSIAQTKMEICNYVHFTLPLCNKATVAVSIPFFAAIKATA